MKKVISLFSVICASGAIIFASCNSSDYNKENTTTTTETSVPGNTQTTIPDTTAGMTNMNMDTSTMKTNTAKTAATAKTKKGKVSSTMMTSTNKNTSMDMDQQGYYNNVEVLPMYPGGQNALDNFINSTIEYPEMATESNIEGKVTVYFAVDEKGKISNPKILGKPLGYGLEDEVLKAVSKMPTWTPGNIKGKNVKTYYTLPVNFRLDQ